MTKKERYELLCDLKRRIHIAIGEFKHIIDLLEIISDEADDLVVNGNAQEEKKK